MGENKYKHEKVKKKWSRKKKIITIVGSIIAIVLITALSFIGYSYYLYSKMDNHNMDRDAVLNEGGKKEEYKHITNIALFGVDNSSDEKVGMADCNMILTINNDTKELKLTSILRDTFVDIPGHSPSNINMAMADGGPELSLKTINTNFDLDIDKFVSVNLNSLPKIIDEVGGVEINVDAEELKFINSYIDGINKLNGTKEAHVVSTGKQLLNGTQATAFCRIRYTEGSDFKRTDRQREVFGEIFESLTSLGMGDLYSFVEEVLPIVSTNLTYGEIVSIGSDILSIGNVELQENRFPNDGDHWSSITETGWYRLNIDKEATTEKMHKFIYSIK